MSLTRSEIGLNVKLDILIAATACFSATLTVSILGQTKPQQPLVNARDAVRQIMANDPETKIEFAEMAHAEHVARFVNQLGKESSHQLAVEWLALVDEAIALPHRSFNGAMGGAMPGPLGSLYNVLVTLPGPESWTQIKALVVKRSPSIDRTALLMLFARLTGDDVGLIHLCEEYEREKAEMRAPGQIGSDHEQSTVQLRLDAYWRLGKSNERHVIELALQNSAEPDFAGVPPTVEKAILLDYLKKPNDPLQTRNSRVMKVAREVVLAHLKEIPYPHWELAEGPQNTDYVLKLMSHYGYQTLFDPLGQGTPVQAIYLRELIVRKELDKAVQFLSDADEVPRLSDVGWPNDKNLVSFVKELQVKVPHKDLTDLLTVMTSEIYQPAEAADRLRSLASDPKTIHDDKLSVLARVIELDEKSGNLDALSADYDAVDRARTSPKDFDPAFDLIDAAVASGNKAFIDKAIAHTIKEPAAFYDNDFIRFLSGKHRYGELEQLALEQSKETVSGLGPLEYGALDLCDVYYLANRPLDVLAILTKFPNWSERSLALENRTEPFSHNEAVNDGVQPLSFYAAWAYSKTGKKDLAVRILRDVLLQKGDIISCYRLLNEIGSKACLSVYNDVLAANPYSHRAMLWKSDLLFKLGRVDQAWSVAQGAKAIEPVGDYPYREKLVDLTRQILTKRGAGEGARKTTNLLAAVRLGARGANLLRVNLLPQAELALSRAVAICPTDCALQAELGHCLELQNRMDEARYHYRKAFESVADELGESQDEQSPVAKMLSQKNLAPMGTAILDRFIAKNPRSAAAYQARGRLNRTADLAENAAGDFRKALVLDPRRIDAIDSLIGLARDARLTPAEVTTLTLRRIDLAIDTDDSGWLGGFGIPSIGDLSPVYRAIRTKLQRFPSVANGPLMQLHAGPGTDRLKVYPEFDRFSLKGRLVGQFFKFAQDVGDIARLYHPTRYPFE